ncbi:hypothetical protein BHE74_00005537 [Ensete ventricosum]|nr:hypothetical protein BHE74_00005537 [Ensete ventricosum]
MHKTARVVAAGANSAPYGRVHLTNILEVAIVLLVINGLRSDTVLGEDSGVKRHEAMGQVSGKRAVARVSDAKCVAARRTAATPASPSVSVEVAIYGRGEGQRLESFRLRNSEEGSGDHAPSSRPSRRCKRLVSANSGGVPSRGNGWKDLIGLDGATRTQPRSGRRGDVGGCSAADDWSSVVGSRCWQHRTEKGKMLSSDNESERHDSRNDLKRPYSIDGLSTRNSPPIGTRSGARLGESRMRTTHVAGPAQQLSVAGTYHVSICTCDTAPRRLFARALESHAGNRQQRTRPPAQMESFGGPAIPSVPLPFYLSFLLFSQPHPDRMDAAQWCQVNACEPMQLVPSASSSTTATTWSNTCSTARSQVVTERRARPQREQALNCPRCNSTNTKFCYYNNYSLTQPRYFCKTCRRYWTEGGSLRNVPVGGGSRKNKKSFLATATSSTATEASAIVSNPKKLPTEHVSPPFSLSTSRKFHEGQDLNLAFPHPGLPEYNDFPNLESSTANNSSSTSSRSIPCNAVGAFSAMELLSSGMTAREIRTFVPVPLPEYPTGFGLQELRAPALNFPMEGIGGGGGGGGGEAERGGSSGGYGALLGMQESAHGRLVFPFEDVKPVVADTSTTPELENSRGEGMAPPGFWNGMIGGGGSW